MLAELHALLDFERHTEVVDVGANPIDGTPPYKALLDAGLCCVTGFEPQPEALAKLNRRKSAYETYLPFVIGDGSPKTLNICRYSGWTSTLTPSTRTLAVFEGYKQSAEVLRQETVPTKTLDAIEELHAIDFLKIDIQGGELAALRGAARHLSNISFIQTEVSFVNLYEGQPAFGEIDIELRKHGFIPHCIAETRKGIISPFLANNDPAHALNQVLEADLVYVRDFRVPAELNDEQLKHICLIAHACFGSFDLAYRCVLALQERGAIAARSAERYIGMLNSSLQAKHPHA